ncbi:DUF3870 domain-containing protein, partial [Bacillus sp. JJ722]|uniref:DUF3870 domain-containing protein n=1 Tax=Bacillus sp. JJ722 TaxID=3122973 RepID=UPI00300016DE
MHTYFLAGHAKLPQDMAAGSVYGSITVTVEVDLEYGVIVDASCTLATEHGRNFIRQLLRGYSLREGPNPLISIIKEYYFGKASHALQAAIKDICNQYDLL